MSGRPLRRAAASLDWLARKRRVAVLLPGVLIIALRLAMLPWNPVPDPMAPDEFSQLLAAKTFASGRWTNPTPPHWVHFEAPYVLMEPSYASKYPPGPPLLMALGIVFFGSAWAGVLLGAALMCSGICWMLQGWVSPRWALAGALLVVGRYSLHHYWINSYWGGCLAAFGGALVLGALPRLQRKASTTAAVAMGVGFVTLMVTRPYEGLVFSLIPGVVVVASSMRDFSSRVPRVILPVAAVTILGALLLAAYNWKVTGSPLLMPYAVYTAQYEPVPHFLWQSRREVPPSVHAEIRSYLSFPNVVEEQRRPGAVGYRLLQVLGFPNSEGWLTLAHPKVLSNLLFALALLISVVLNFRDRKMRIPLVMLLLTLAASAVETFFYDHYAAPAAGLMILIVVQGLRHASLWHRSLGRALPLVVAGLALAAVVGYAAVFVRFAMHPPQAIVVDRPRVLAHVGRYPGKHLILMRFGGRYNIHDGEWIYNEPNLASAKVVWARDLGPKLNRKLLEHFADRQVWYVFKNRGPARIYRAEDVAEPAFASVRPDVQALLR